MFKASLSTKTASMLISRNFCVSSAQVIQTDGIRHSFLRPEDISLLRKRIEGSCIPENDAVAKVYDRASSLSLDTPGALFFLASLASGHEASSGQLLCEVVRRIEEEYFSGGPQWMSESSPYSTLIQEVIPMSNVPGISFREVLHSLPSDHKALLMRFTPARITKSRRIPLTRDEIEARWHKLDPVDMETVEREHFLKTKQVLRTRDVRAKPTPAPVGSRLRQVLGMEFMEKMDDMNVDDFLKMGSSLLTAPRHSVFHRDLKFDAQFKMCRKIMSMSLEEVGHHVLTLSLILSHFEDNLEIPNRIWNRRIIPALKKDLGCVSSVPSMYEHLNEPSRWALLTATVLTSGRVKATPRLMTYLTPKFSGALSGLDPDATDTLLSGLVQAGVAWEPFMKTWSDSSEPE